MRFPAGLERAAFLRRDNRFRARVATGDGILSAHVPNSGRLSELFTPGAPVWIHRHTRGDARKTACDLLLVEYGGVLVSVDARLPNRLLAEALAGKRLPQFARYDAILPEATVGQSRLDFLLSTGPDRLTGERCWVETKSVTLVEGGVALFPDAPTERGVKHLDELVGLRRRGDQVAVVFVIQRPDATTFRPHPTAHPLFASTLREAAEAGVEVLAWNCDVSLDGIALGSPVPVCL